MSAANAVGLTLAVLATALLLSALLFPDRF